jgi:hypothetical protein
MYSSKQCRDASAECLGLAKLAPSGTEARMLRDLAHSWVRVANQTERYISLTESTPSEQTVIRPSSAFSAPSDAPCLMK